MVVTLPETLDAASLTSLAEALEGEREPIVVAGAGADVFCRGLRLDGCTSEAAITPFLRVVRVLRAGPPAVAFVDGDARGAGVGLAAACDLVIASTRARFGLSELWFGLWPAAIHPLLAERVTVARLRWLAITGRTVDAQEAMTLGLVDRLGETMTSADAALREARRAEPEAVRFYKTMTAPLAAVEEGARATAERLDHPEVRRRVTLFAEGSVPWA